MPKTVPTPKQKTLPKKKQAKAADQEVPAPQVKAKAKAEGSKPASAEVEPNAKRKPALRTTPKSKSAPKSAPTIPPKPKSAPKPKPEPKPKTAVRKRPAAALAGRFEKSGDKRMCDRFDSLVGPVACQVMRALVGRKSTWVTTKLKTCFFLKVGERQVVSLGGKYLPTDRCKDACAQGLSVGSHFKF